MTRAPTASRKIRTDSLREASTPKGVNFVLGDGSVRFVTNGISPTTWSALSTRAEGEMPGDF